MNALWPLIRVLMVDLEEIRLLINTLLVMVLNNCLYLQSVNERASSTRQADRTCQVL